MAARGASATCEHCQSRLALAWSRSACFTPHGIISGGTSPVRLCRGSEPHDRASLHPSRPTTTGRPCANVDVIATFGDGPTKIAQQATSAIPIVTIGDDLLGSGLIGSLSRPGSNTTGISIIAAELSAKRLELLSTIMPGLSSVAGLWDPTSGPSQVAMSENAARTMKLKLQIMEVAHRDDLDGAFRAARDGHVQAVNVFSSPFLASLYREIIGRAAEYRLPAIYQWREHAEAGGLMSYGPSLPAMWQQDGAMVARILKGAKPSDMPVEQPTKFELVINQKTAKALGLTISRDFLLVADEVIE
jgi:putative tryptophan/tyrosine transport system substrate-binding protein